MNIPTINKQITILTGSKQRHGNTPSQRDPTRAAGDDRGKTKSIFRSVDRGGGDAAVNQQPHPPARHQGDAGGRQGRPGAGNRKIKKYIVGADRCVRPEMIFSPGNWVDMQVKGRHIPTGYFVRSTPTVYIFLGGG
jgi:hypothetical protein